MQRLILFVLSLGVATALGCSARAGWMPTNPPPHPMVPKAADQVQLFTAGPPERPYVEVGIIAAAPGLTTSDFDVLQKLREEGGARGCDGLIVNGTNKLLTGSTVGHTASYSEQTAFRAACVVYR